MISPAPSPMREKRMNLPTHLPHASVQTFIDKVIADLFEKNKIRGDEGINSLIVLKEVQKRAIAGNHLDVFNWLHSSNMPWTASACAAAAANGDLVTLQILRAKRAPWNVKTAYQAAFHNRFDLLKWAVTQKVPLDETVCAAAAHNLEMLKWLRSRGCPWDASTCAEAAAAGNLEALKWAIQQGCPSDARVFQWAVHYLEEPTLQYLLGELKLSWEPSSMHLAAAQGNKEGILLARAHDCPWTEEITVWAKDLPMLQWLRSLGCPWNEQVCAQAASNGDLERFIWAFQNGCPSSGRVYEVAATKGHLNIIQWVSNHTDIPIDPKKIFKIAKEEGQTEVMDWIERMKVQFRKHKTHDSATSGKRRRTLKTAEAT